MDPRDSQKARRALEALEAAIGPVPRGTEAILAAEERWQVPTYAKAPIALVSGEGCHVVDADGRCYLDLYGGHAVALLGHCPPRLVQAVKAQAERLVFYSNAVYVDVRAAAAEALARLAPEGLRRVFLCSSGAEANETALKIARKHTGRSRVVSLEEGFHGRTLGALGATGIPAYRDACYPLPPEHDFVPFGDLDAAERAIGPETAAMILEPIPSMGGIRTAEAAYYRGLSEIARAAGTLLIFDEVQTGFGRTGTLFFGEHVGVTPDLITGAKGIAGGLPAACVFVREDLAERIRPGEQGTTFGGGPLACAAIAAVARALVEEDLPARAARVGAKLKTALEAVEGVEAVVGRGLLLGLDLDRPAKPLVGRLRDAGFLVGGSRLEHQLRLMPPLVLEDAEAASFPPALAEVLATR